MKDREHGYPLCEKDGKTSKGPKVRGGSHAVSIPLACPKGTRLVGVSHLHPSGSLELSSQDKRTAREKKLKVVCVTTPQGQARCYKVKKRRQAR